MPKINVGDIIAPRTIETIETSVRSVLDPASWLPALKGLAANGLSLPERGDSALGLPADFLVGRDGRVLARKYGVHAYDQWTLDELLALARRTPADEPVRTADPVQPVY